MKYSQINNSNKINNLAVIQTGKDRENIIKNIDESFNDLRSKNVMIQVKNYNNGSDTIATVLYNKHKEAILEYNDNAYKTIYFKNKKSLTLADNLYYTASIDYITMMESALKMASDDNQISVLISPDNTDTKNEYIIDIVGNDNIKKLYSYVDEELANLVLDTLNDEVGYRIIYVIENNTVTNGVCYTYRKDDKTPEDITWNDLSPVWLFEGYVEVYDWELNELWYTIDLENTNEDIENLFINEYNLIKLMLNQFMKDNNINQQ